MTLSDAKPSNAVPPDCCLGKPGKIGSNAPGATKTPQQWPQPLVGRFYKAMINWSSVLPSVGILTNIMMQNDEHLGTCSLHISLYIYIYEID